MSTSSSIGRDVVIAIGYDIVECAPAKWGARENMTIVHIDSAPADVNKRYQPAVEVVGDISESLYEILRCAHRTGEPEFALALRQTMVQSMRQWRRTTAAP